MGTCRLESRRHHSPNQIARLLSEFRVYPETIRIGDRTPKGYYLNKFAEAFTRYLGPQGVNQPPHRHNVESMGTSEPFQTATEESVLRSETGKKLASNGQCGGVSDQNAENASLLAPLNAETFPPVCVPAPYPDSTFQPGTLLTDDDAAFLESGRFK